MRSNQSLSRQKTYNLSALPGAWRGLRVSGALVLVGSLGGCRRAPSFSLLGSFFPVWLLCAIAGIAGAFLVHFLLLRLGRDEQLAPGLLVWPAMAILFSLSLWLLFFS